MYKDKTREDLIEEVNKLLNIEDNYKLTWADVCEKTDFDSFVTAFCFGTTWKDDDMRTMEITHLKAALYNMTKYPKEK